MAHSKEHYIKIWGYLVVLLVVSVAGPEIAPKVASGNVKMTIVLLTAFGIALVKAYMVIVEFMHLPLDKKFCTYLLSTCMAFMLLFFAFVAPDVMNHEGQNWVNTAAKKEVTCAKMAQKDKTFDKAKCKAMPYKAVAQLAKKSKGSKSAPAKKQPTPKK